MTGPGFITRLGLMYAAIFFVGGVQQPYFPVWLHAEGLDERSIGFVLAVPLMVRVAAIPLIARSADKARAFKAGALQRVIAGCAIASVGGYALVGAASGAVLIAVAFALASFAYTPVMPLVETYALRGLAARGRAYGPVRLWGSVAYVAAAFVAGALLNVFPASAVIWLMVGACALVAGAALALEPAEDGHARVPAQAGASRLLRNPAFLLAIVGPGLIQASHATYYSFSTLAWTQAGFGGWTIAALWAIGVVAEITLFASQSRLPRVLTPERLVVIGALGGVVRWGAMALDPPVAVLPVLQVLHALTFGATHLGSLAMVLKLAPHSRAASAQGYFAIALGLTMATTTAVSGWLFAGYGPATYAAMALAAAAGGVCAIGAQRLPADMRA